MIIDEVLGKAPPECQTHSEKIAFAFGWFKAMEQIDAAVLAERERIAASIDVEEYHHGSWFAREIRSMK